MTSETGQYLYITRSFCRIYALQRSLIVLSVLRKTLLLHFSSCQVIHYFLTEDKTFDLVLISFALGLKATKRASRSNVLSARHSSRYTKSHTNMLDMDDINGVNVLSHTYNTEVGHRSPNTHKLSKIVPLPS